MFKNYSFFALFPFLNQLNQIEEVLFVVKDLDGYDSIKRLLDGLKDETEKWLISNFDQWRSESLMAISTGDLTYVLLNLIPIILKYKSIRVSGK